MFNKKDIAKIIVEFKESLLNQGIPIEHLWLFGSYAQGKQHKYSDIDLAVFSSKFVENPFENTKYLQKAKRIPQIQAHLYTIEDYLNNPFVKEISKHKVDF